MLVARKLDMQRAIDEQIANEGQRNLMLRSFIAIVALVVASPSFAQSFQCIGDEMSPH